ncbi:MAG: hypothetical protein P8074_16380 [Anaerolineales bacterium]
MNDLYTYQIELRGQLNENDINAMSPFQMTIVRANTASTYATVYTDQSGLIGLIRHLHGKGFVLLSIIREQ